MEYKNFIFDYRKRFLIEIIFSFFPPFKIIKLCRGNKYLYKNFIKNKYDNLKGFNYYCFSNKSYLNYISPSDIEKYDDEIHNYKKLSERKLNEKELEYHYSLIASLRNNDKFLFCENSLSKKELKLFNKYFVIWDITKKIKIENKLDYGELNKFYKNNSIKNISIFNLKNNKSEKNNILFICNHNNIIKLKIKNTNFINNENIILNNYINFFINLEIIKLFEIKLTENFFVQLNYFKNFKKLNKLLFKKVIFITNNKDNFFNTLSNLINLFFSENIKILISEINLNLITNDNKNNLKKVEKEKKEEEEIFFPSKFKEEQNIIEEKILEINLKKNLIYIFPNIIFIKYELNKEESTELIKNIYYNKIIVENLDYFESINKNTVKTLIIKNDDIYFEKNDNNKKKYDNIEYLIFESCFFNLDDKIKKCIINFYIKLFPNLKEIKFYLSFFYVSDFSFEKIFNQLLGNKNSIKIKLKIVFNNCLIAKDHYYESCCWKIRFDQPYNKFIYIAIDNIFIKYFNKYVKNDNLDYNIICNLNKENYKRLVIYHIEESKDDDEKKDEKDKNDKDEDEKNKKEKNDD